MPRIKSEDVQADNLYGVKNYDEGSTFRERLMKRFASHDWVRVVNVDTEPYRWQYLPALAESVSFSQDGLMRMVDRTPVEVYELSAGDSEVLIGENAYVMIEGLYKKMAAKAAIARNPDVRPGVARSFNWTDGKQQDTWIDRILQGKESPSFRSKKVDLPPPPVVEEQPKVTKRMRRS